MALIDIDYELRDYEENSKEELKALTAIKESIVSRNEAKTAIDRVFESSFNFGWEMGKNDERKEVLDIIENIVTLIENGELQFDEVLSALSDRIIERD